MPAPTNTTQTYTGTVNREDLSDIVYLISPTETPFMSAIAKAKATSTLHEWTTDVLATAANNAQIEGDDSTAGVVNPGTRVTNRTQISRKVVRISSTQQEVNSAGGIYTMAKQMAKMALELKRDMEVALTQNTTAITGNSTTARQLRGLEGWTATSNSFGSGGVAPNPSSNTGPTDGTQRAFTERLTEKRPAANLLRRRQPRLGDGRTSAKANVLVVHWRLHANGQRRRQQIERGDQRVRQRFLHS